MAAVVVVMGVSGSGKSTVGSELARRLGVPFVDGDSLHSPRNVALMASGTALTDADRQDWLRAVGEVLRAGQAAGVVVSCSALKRSYRDGLRAAAPAVRFLYLQGRPELLRERLLARQGHYMPPSLLDSQLEALEPPAPDEAVLSFDIGAAPEAIASAAHEQLDRATA